MLTKRIIPCLDMKDGRVVKGVQFVDLADAGDPVEVAAAYDAQGADEVCFLDINASHEKRGTMIELVARIADRLTVPFSVGGGVRSLDDVRALLRAGADKVSVNSAAIGAAGAGRRDRRSARLGEPDRRDGRAPPRRRRRRRAAGRSSATAAATRPGSTRSSGWRAWRRSARARSCSPAWTATARATATTSS